MPSRRGWIRWTVSAAAALAVAALAVFWFSYRPSGLLEVSVLDVGQGDAVLLETPHGHVILIDGGPGDSVMRRLGEELPFWERTIDLVVLTHPHEDHLAGLNDVIRRYRVGTVMTTGVETGNPSYRAFLDEAAARSVPLNIVDGPQELTLDGITVSVLYPRASVRRLDNLNNGSIVIRTSYGDIDMLFTGDAETEVEEELLADKAVIGTEILKAGHHGSDTSSSEAFLAALKPELALISCGTGNTYGHPSLRTLRRFDRLGIRYRRTDLEGTIHIKTDGRQIFE